MAKIGNCFVCGNGILESYDECPTCKTSVKEITSFRCAEASKSVSSDVMKSAKNIQRKLNELDVLQFYAW